LTNFTPLAIRLSASITIFLFKCRAAPKEKAPVLHQYRDPLEMHPAVKSVEFWAKLEAEPNEPLEYHRQDIFEAISRWVATFSSRLIIPIRVP
jgi:hypothetical protein